MPANVDQSEISTGVYAICHTCKEGKFSSSYEEVDRGWETFHFSHGGSVTLEAGRDFLSKYLGNGFIDVDRPDLQPTPVKPEREPVTMDKMPPFGMPGMQGALAVQRSMRSLTPRDPVPEEIGADPKYDANVFAGPPPPPADLYPDASLHKTLYEVTNAEFDRIFAFFESDRQKILELKKANEEREQTMRRLSALSTALEAFLHDST